MKDFVLHQARSAEEALDALPKDFAPGGARVLAGGQDLLGELKDHLEDPEALVNIKHVAGMRGVEETAAGVRFGALTTIAEIAEMSSLDGGLALLREAAASIASPQIRNQATLGGNLCQRPRCWYYRNPNTICLKKGGDECFAYEGMSKYNAILGGGPSFIVHPSDMAPALVALDATVTFQSARDERTVPLGEFFTLPSQGAPLRENVLRANELVTRVDVTAERRGWKSTYIKFKERGSFDWALSAVALAVRLEGDVIREARLVLGGVAPTPWRCGSSEELMVGARLDEETAGKVAEDALRGAEPLAHNGYKIPLTQALIKKAVRALA